MFNIYDCEEKFNKFIDDFGYGRLSNAKLKEANLEVKGRDLIYRKVKVIARKAHNKETIIYIDWRRRTPWRGVIRWAIDRLRSNSYRIGKGKLLADGSFYG